MKRMLRLFSTLTYLLLIYTTAFGQNNQRLFVEDAAEIQMVLIPSGEYEMGSEFYKTVQNMTEQSFFKDESPIHAVKITRSFWVSITETTVAQFRIFTQETGYITDAETNGMSLGEYNEHIASGGKVEGSWIQGKGLNWKNPGYQHNENQPVTHVSWNDAKAFCQWLSDKTGRPYRLLTEAEWEWAAGTQNHTLYSWGNQEPNNKAGVNIADASFNQIFPNWKYPVLMDYQDYFVFPAPVSSYLPNSFGLYDMTGNVWEWVEDIYSSSYYEDSPINDPQGAKIPSDLTGIKRVHRGGGFDWELPYLRVHKRRAAPPSTTSIHIGFRIALDTQPTGYN